MDTSKKLNLDIVWPRLVNISDEIATTLIHTAFSFDVIQMHDLATAVFDARGDMLAASTIGAVGHYSGMLPLMEILLRRFDKEDVLPGDVFITNDPWVTSAHTPDVFTITPVFKASQLVAFVVCLVHQVDVGGRAGSGLAEVVYEEGLLMPLMKLCREGKPNEDLFRIFERNFRFSEKVIGDLRAQIGAGEVGARRIIQLMDEYALASLDEVSQEIVGRTEASMRAGLATVTAGKYHYESPIELFNEKDEPLLVALTATFDDDGFHADFDGSSPQVRRPINAPFLNIRNYVAVCLKMVIDPHTPFNSGTFRPISLNAPEGTIVNAKFPAAVCWRMVPLHMAADAMFHILSKVAPDQSPAGSGSAPAWMFYSSGLRKSGAPFMLHVLFFGGMGARPGKDGIAGVSFPYSVRDICVEDMEMEAPFLVDKREIVTDSGGAGQWRGGCSEEIVLRVVPGGDVDPTKQSVFAGGAGRFRFPALGIYGGMPGTSGQILINGEPPEAWKFAGSIELHFSADDVLTFRMPGGGGYGDPAQRDPSLIAWDLKNGYVSEEGAMQDYAYDAPSREAQRS